MAEKIGIKEVREIIHGADRLAVAIIKLVSDGLDVTDAVALFAKFQNDTEFRKAMMDMVQGADKALKELKDLDLKESIQLAKDGLDFTEHVLTAIQENKKAEPDDMAPETLPGPGE